MQIRVIKKVTGEVPMPEPGDSTREGVAAKAKPVNFRKAVLDKYGYTHGCPGCNGVLEARRKVPMHW